MADDIKIRINDLFLRVEAVTLTEQYNVVEELLLQVENILETVGITLNAEAQVSLRNSISAMRTVLSAASQDSGLVKTISNRRSAILHGIWKARHVTRESSLVFNFSIAAIYINISNSCSNITNSFI